MPVVTKVALGVVKRHLAIAAGLTKTICATSQKESTFELALVRVNNKELRVTATNGVSSLDVHLDLQTQIPELEDDPISFLMGVNTLFDLIKEETEHFVNFILDDHNHSLTYKIERSELVLPIRSSSEWPNIDPRFDLAGKECQAVNKSSLTTMLSFNKNFLPSGIDVAMYLVEVRNGLAISSDRKKFGFFVAKEFNDLKLRLPGDQVASLEKAVEFFPKEEIQVFTSDKENILVTSVPGLSIALAFSKSCLTLPVGLDNVPMIEEPHQVTVDALALNRSLGRLSSVCAKVYPKIKLEFTDTLKLIVPNETGHESTDTLPCQRTTGAGKVSISIDFLEFKKLIKIVETDEVSINIGKDSGYLKLVCETDDYETNSVLQAS